MPNTTLSVAPAIAPTASSRRRPRSGLRRRPLATTRFVTFCRIARRRLASVGSIDFSSRRAPGTGPPLKSADTTERASASPTSPPTNSTAYRLRPVSTIRSSPATARSRIVAVTPLAACPTRSADTMALTSGGSYWAMIVPRPGWSRQRMTRIAIATIIATTATTAPTAPVIAAADAPNDSSRGSNVPDTNPAAIVRFSYGPMAVVSATMTRGTESAVVSDSHGVVEPVQPR